MDSIRDSLEGHVGKHQHFQPPDYESMVAAIEDDEFYLRRAHSMFHVCKHPIVDSWVASPDEKNEDDHQIHGSYLDREKEEKPRPAENCWSTGSSTQLSEPLTGVVKHPLAVPTMNKHYPSPHTTARA